MTKVSKRDFVNKLKETVALPESAFDGVEIAKVVTVDPISINCFGQIISSNFIYVSPFCQSFTTAVFKHTHKYKDWNNGEGASEGNNWFDTQEALASVEVWRDLKVGDEVLVIRTNKSQKYILLCRVSKLDER